MKWLSALLLLFSSTLFAGDNATCVPFSGTKPDAATWCQHGIIAGVIVGGVAATAPKALAPAAIITCGGFVVREMNGKGDLFDNTDRIMDWVVPCAVSAGIWWWRKDKPPIVPWFQGDTGSVTYMTEW